VSAWELWNEENNTTFWRGSVAQCVSLLKAGYQGVKAGDSAATVVLGGLMYNDDAWLRQIYAAGGRGAFDAVATHRYQGVADTAPEQPDKGTRESLTHLPAVRAVMVGNGDADKPIWLTEFGWSDHDNGLQPPNWARGVSESVQVDYAVRALRYAAANWPYVSVLFWYKERAWNNPTADPIWLGIHLEGYGLLRANRSERPVYTALQGSWLSAEVTAAPRVRR